MMKTRIAAILMACAAISASAKQPKVGEAAPEFQLKLVDGNTIRLSDLRGQVVVLNFWATWCVPCRAELPALDTYQRMRRDKGLRVFAVTTEDSVPLFQMKKLFAAMAIQPAKSVKGPYEIMGGVPTNYVIDRAGRIRYAKSGAFDLDTLNRVLVPLLNEPAPAAATS